MRLGDNRHEKVVGDGASPELPKIRELVWSIVAWKLDVYRRRASRLRTPVYTTG